MERVKLIDGNEYEIIDIIPSKNILKIMFKDEIPVLSDTSIIQVLTRKGTLCSEIIGYNTEYLREKNTLYLSNDGSVCGETPTFTEPEKTMLEKIDYISVYLDNLERKVLLVEPDINCTLDEYKKYKVNLSKKNLQDYLANNSVEFVRNGVNGYYSITKDKQDLLGSEIILASNSSTYQPSWNEKGKSCTYDWTLEELMGLAYKISEVVKPLVTAQQTMEVKINESISKEEVNLVEVTF